MEPIIKTDSLGRIFKNGINHVHALKNISIEIIPEAITIIRGRSGSGKTTLINLLGALDRPTTGKVFFNNQEIGSIPERQRDEIRRKKMGFVFQSLALISLMSAYENVEFALRLSGYQNDRKQRAEKCLVFVGLRKRMSHRPAEMSGGEQQRVAIARAIVHHPLVIFADEPTAELDTHMGLQVIKLFRDLVDDENTTIVMTTHDPKMVDLADRVYTLEDGSITDILNNNIKNNGRHR
jgi:putative ABC transport system ATP-binding protein